MTIRFRCNHCSLSLTAGDDRAGAKFQCPRCGREGAIPGATQEQTQPATGGTAGLPSSGQTSSSTYADPLLGKLAVAHGRPSKVDSSEEIEPVKFGTKPGEDELMDMTPMVDVTFLLLIFFMVTAAYSLQKSIEVPSPDREESATQTRTFEELENDDDFVIIRIAKDNTVWVDEREAPSEQEVLVKLRESRDGKPGTTGRGPTSLLVAADQEARHETVVMCLDAGNALGFENMRLSCVDEEEL